MELYPTLRLPTISDRFFKCFSSFKNSQYSNHFSDLAIWREEKKAEFYDYNPNNCFLPKLPKTLATLFHDWWHKWCKWYFVKHCKCHFVSSTSLEEPRKIIGWKVRVFRQIKKNQKWLVRDALLPRFLPSHESHHSIIIQKNMTKSEHTIVYFWLWFSRNHR